MIASICYARKVNSESLAQQELEIRRIEQEEARLAREREAYEERKKDKEREATRDQMSQLMNLQMLKALGGGSVSNCEISKSQPEPSIAIEKVEVNLKLKEDTDSDSYPVKICLTTFEDLVTALRDLCEIKEDKPVKVILICISRILDFTLLENGRLYNVEYIVRDNYVRIYLD